MRLLAPVRAGTRACALLALLLACFAAPVSADATVFIGSTSTPANRAVKGVAIGFDVLIIGFEFEYADTNEEILEAAPGLRTGMGNVLLQTPIPIAGIQFYGTIGAGDTGSNWGKSRTAARKRTAGSTRAAA